MNQEEVPEHLHRLVDNQNDWDLVPPERRTRLQRIAKKTKGILTLANVITVVSTALFIDGINDYINGDKVTGVAKVFFGSLGDVADGYAAHKTKTKGRVGKALDPLSDYGKLAYALYALTGEVIPEPAAIAVAAPKVVDGIATVVGTLRHRNMDATAEGKYTAATIITGIGAFMLSGALDDYWPQYVEYGLDTIGWVGTVGGGTAHWKATLDYGRQAFGSTNANDSKLAA